MRPSSPSASRNMGRQGGLIFEEQKSQSIQATVAERRADAVQKRLPADVARPGFEPRALDPLRLVIVESVGDAVAVEPGARLLHGVTILDAVDGDGPRLRHKLTPNRSSLAP